MLHIEMKIICIIQTVWKPHVFVDRTDSIVISPDAVARN